MSSERASVRGPSPWSQVRCAIVFIGLTSAGLFLGYLAYTEIRAFAAHTQFKSIPVIPAPIIQQRQQRQQPEQPRQQSYPDPSQKPGPQAHVPTEEIYPDIENKDRVNILFLGIDQRPGEPVACRTDTMILLSVNPKDMSVSLLSIPRDLWVPIRHPKHTEDRINTAHYWGETENYPGGGPELAKDTVQYNLGVPIHYYVRLNFTGFEQIVDRIGGIDIDVPATIHDTQYPGPNNSYVTMHIDAGHQHLNGEMALKYARTRLGGGDGDFSRMHRQQQVILALRDRVLSLPNLPQLIPQLPQLYRDMGDSVDTDIPVDLMFTLAKWAQQIERENIHMETIDRRMTQDMKTSDGRAVLLYDREKARPIVEALFSDPTPEALAVTTSQFERLEAEKAHIAVYNGTGNTGLAARISSFLAIQGIDIALTDNADHFDYEYTTVTVYSDKPYTVQWLTNWLIDIGIAEPGVVKQQSAYNEIDIAITIGNDFPVDKIR